MKGIRAYMFLMATDGITTRLQQEMGLLQHELSQLDNNMEAKLDARSKEFCEDFKATIGIQGLNQDRGKGLLGTPPPGFPPNDTVVMSATIDGGHLGTSSCIGTIIRWEDSFSYNVHGLMVQTFVVGELS
ncbi:hypothetical protein PVK06_021109 [Gossypium arboreum]|uniref:Uncharacterized protein n=1 Tax=Gossypium arboreum TaxID=29729 RepID=A0ABR0PPK4_GOSAR|nr:hypothetical protein PVK06_021109 [Gossypium arboreum]